MSFINPDVVPKDVLSDLSLLSMDNTDQEGWSKKSEIGLLGYEGILTASFFEKDGDIVVAVYSELEDGTTLQESRGIDFDSFAGQIQKQLKDITTENSKVYFTGFGSGGDIVNFLYLTQLSPELADLKNYIYVPFASTVVISDLVATDDPNQNLFNIGFRNDPLFNIQPGLDPNKENVASLFYTNNSYWGLDTQIENIKSLLDDVTFFKTFFDGTYFSDGIFLLTDALYGFVPEEESLNKNEFLEEAFTFVIIEAVKAGDIIEKSSDWAKAKVELGPGVFWNVIIDLSTLGVQKSLEALQEWNQDDPHAGSYMIDSIDYLVDSTFYDYINYGLDISFVNSSRNERFSIKDIFLETVKSLDPNAKAIDDKASKILLGSKGDNWIDGFQFSPNWIEGYSGDDEIVGGDGSDRLKGGDGNDILDGADGKADLAIYDGTFWEYVLNNNNEEWMIDITENNIPFNFELSGVVSGSKGTDLLKNIEFVEFDNEVDNEVDKWVYAVEDLLDIELIESSLSILGGDLNLRYQNKILTDEHTFELSFTPSLPQKIYIAYDFELNGGFTTDVGWNDSYTYYDHTKTSSYVNAINEIKRFVNYLADVEGDSPYTTLAINGALFGKGQNYDLVDAISYLDNPRSSSFNDLKTVGYKTPSENPFSSLNYSGPAEAAVRWFTNDYEITPEKNQNKFFYITEGFGLPLENLDTDIYSVNVYKEAEAINEPDPYFHLKNAGAPEVSFEVEGGHPAWVNTDKDWFARLSDVSEAHAIGMSGESIPLGDLQSVGLSDGVLVENLNSFSDYVNDITISTNQQDPDTGKLTQIDEKVLVEDSLPNEYATEITLNTDPANSFGSHVITVNVDYKDDAVADYEFSYEVAIVPNYEDDFYVFEEENTDANSGSTDDEIIIVDDGLIDDEIIIVDDGLIDDQSSIASASGQTFSHFKDHVIQILSSNNVASNPPILDEFII